MKKYFAITLFSFLLLSCENREGKKSKKDDKILKDLIIAGAISQAALDFGKVPCSATVSEANADFTVNVPAEGSYRICGNEKLTGASVKFDNARKYRITATNGTQVLESSGCNSKTFSIDVTFSSLYGTKIVTAVDSLNSAEHTVDSGSIYKITSSGPVDPRTYSCANVTPISKIAEAYSVFFEPL